MLTGRRTLRDVVRYPRLSEAVGSATAALADRWRAIGPEERASLLDQLSRAERELRERLGMPEARNWPAGSRARPGTAE